MEATISINLEIFTNSLQIIIGNTSKSAQAKHTRARLLAANMSDNIFCIADASMARRKQSWRTESNGEGQGVTGGHEFGHGAWGGTGVPVVAQREVKC